MIRSEPIRALVVEDNPGDFRLLEEALKATGTGATFLLRNVGSLAAARPLLEHSDFDIVLLDLSLPDSRGLETFVQLAAQALDVPIIILSGLDDETMAVAAVRNGAQDYLIKGTIEGPLLKRAIHYAIERHRLQSTLRRLALLDPLTGLFNRRGFEFLAKQQIDLGKRNNRGLCLLFGDLDGLKDINDKYGHEAGDRALQAIAGLLRKTFRQSDIVGRFGGDEFVVLCLGVCPDICLKENILSRFERNQQAYNETRELDFDLRLSFGVARFEPEAPCSFDELVRLADERMYREKKSKRSIHVLFPPGRLQEEI